jgi:hypothetical protein
VAELVCLSGSLGGFRKGRPSFSCFQGIQTIVQCGYQNMQGHGAGLLLLLSADLSHYPMASLIACMRLPYLD